MIGRNALWAIVQVIFSTGILFAVYYFTVRAVGIDQVGLLSIVSTTAGVTRISELGLSGVVTRFLPEHLARGENADASEVIVTSVSALGICVGIFSLLAWPTLNTLLPLFVADDLLPQARSIVPIALLSLWMSVVANCIAMSLDGINRADRRAQINVLSLSIFGAVAILSINRLGIAAIPLAQALQAACAFVLSMFLLFRKVPALRSARPSMRCFKRIWAYGAHLQTISILILFYDPLTRLLLNHFGNLSAVGYYDLANRLISQVRSIIVSANQVMVPYYANLNATNPKSISAAVNINFVVVLAISAVVFSQLAVSLFLVSQLWLGHIDQPFIAICMILIIGNYANTLSVGIYFMNIGIGTAINNVFTWVVIIAVNLFAGTVGGVIFGVFGVMAAVSMALVCGSFFTIHAFLRENDLSVGSLMTSAAVKYCLVGAIVFLIAVLNLVGGFPFGVKTVAILIPIALGGIIWVMFFIYEMLDAKA